MSGASLQGEFIQNRKTESRQPSPNLSHDSHLQREGHVEESLKAQSLWVHVAEQRREVRNFREEEFVSILGRIF